VVRNLLAFGRAAPTLFARADPGPLALRCVALLHHKAELAGVTLEACVPERLPAACLDAAQVEQLMLALTLNALEATPSGGSVSLRLRADDADPELEGVPSVVIEVADTGCGIPEELRAQVFEPFFTTKEAGKGVGLGLAVAYGIVTRHRGRIAFDSRVGEGTLFRAHLPRQRAPGASSSPESDACAEGGTP
jgi:two-component system NtrC family sensor kinase